MKKLSPYANHRKILKNDSNIATAPVRDNNKSGKAPPPLEPYAIYWLPIGIRKYDISSGQETTGRERVGDFILRPINAGNLPPNFVHTWALDIRCSEDEASEDYFMFDFKDINLDWGENGDTLTVINAIGNPQDPSYYKTTYSTHSEYFTKTFKTKLTPFDTKPFKRIYLVLETSPKNDIQRSFVLKGLLIHQKPPQNAEVRLLEDDVDYDTTLPIFEGVTEDFQGKFQIAPPWYLNNQSMGWKPPGQDQNEPMPPPRRSEGWYLLGKNVTDPRSKFYTLLYYNEGESKLRAYLYNLSLTSDCSVFNVEIALMSKYDELKGAFFPVDPNPNKWDKARGIVPIWETNKWTMIEVPMLYPMGNNLPTVENQKKESRNEDKPQYQSLYEDKFVENFKNIRLRISVWPMQITEIHGSIIGKAVGYALEESSKNLSLLDIASMTHRAIKTGIDVYSGVKKVSDSTINYVLSHYQDFDINTSDFLVALSGGVGAMSPILAAAGGAISLFGSLLGAKNPLLLTVELAMSGKLYAEATSDMQPSASYFYLPGRFSIIEAFDPEGIEGCAYNNKSLVDCLIPRYDRAMGLFGFKYNPGRVYIPVYRDDYYHLHLGMPFGALFEGKNQDDWNEADKSLQRTSNFLIPNSTPKFYPHKYVYAHGHSYDEAFRRSYELEVRSEPWITQDKPFLDYSIPLLLPVVYNPYAVVNIAANSDIYEQEVLDHNPPVRFSHIFCRIYAEPTGIDYNHSFASIPALSYSQFKGFRLNIVGPYLPQLYRKFVNCLHIPVTSTVWHKRGFLDNLLENFPERPGSPPTYEHVNDTIYWYKAVSELNKSGKNPNIDSVLSQMNIPGLDEVQRGRNKDEWLADGFNASNLTPLQDVIYCWEIAYSYYNRERQSPQTKKITLSSPTWISLTRAVYCRTYEVWNQPQHPENFRIQNPHEVLIGTRHYRVNSTSMQEIENRT